MRSDSNRLLFAATTSLLSLAFSTATAFAQTAEPTSADMETSDDTIVVFGRGETRQVQQIGAADIAVLLPGTSPLKAIEKLPSVNFQAADPFGNYEWSTRVTIRSFNQNQLGFNFDGIPLGDMTYGNHNGLHISRVVSPENIGIVRVSQGAGTLGTQSTNNLGGTVETLSRDPLNRLAVDGSGTYGMDNTIRAFARLNWGMADGLRGFLSYGYGATDKYKGDGTQDQHMVNAKFVMPVGVGEIDGWFSYSDRREQDYQDMSLDMLDRLGFGWDNTFPDYARAVLYADIGNNRGETGAAISNAAAGTVYPGNVRTVDDAYYDASGLRRDLVAALGYKMPIMGEGEFAIKGYYHHNRGMGLWGTPYVPSPGGAPISIRTTEYEIDRGGVFGSLSLPFGNHTVSVNGWYETNSFNQARRFYGLTSRTDPGRSFRDYPKDPFFTQWEFDFKTETLQYSVADRVDLGALTLNVGWKGFRVTNEAEAVIQASFPEGKITAEDWFQPHIGLVFEMSPATELFAGFTQSTRAFASATTTGPFSTNQTGFDAIRDSLKPETSDTYELGVRLTDSRVNGVFGFYYVDFQNRLLSAASGPSIVGSPSVLQNVGSVRAIGLEAAVDVRLAGGVNLFASYSYNDATYEDDVFNRSGVLLAAIKGKTVVDSPKHMLRGEVRYEADGFFVRTGVNWMTKRYFTYTNDRSVGARALIDASVGYRFTDQIEVQVSGNNLLDNDYIATVGSGGFGNSGDRQTLLVGAPRQIFATIRAGF